MNRDRVGHEPGALTTRPRCPQICPGDCQTKSCRIIVENLNSTRVLNQYEFKFFLKVTHGFSNLELVLHINNKINLIETAIRVCFLRQGPFPLRAWKRAFFVSFIDLRLKRAVKIEASAKKY